MNEKLPNSMLDALAREAKPTEHPSADVLAAFVERALVESEQQSVIDHLARCRECRDVVFVAGNAADDAGAEQQVAVAALARPRWRSSLAWAAPLAAVLLLAGGYFVWHGTTKVVTGPELASKSVAEAPVPKSESSRDAVPTQSAPPSAAASSVAKPRAMAAPVVASPATKEQTGNPNLVVMNAAPPPQNKDLGTTVEMAEAAPRAPATAIGKPATGVARAPQANGFVQSESQAAQQIGTADSISLAVNRLAASAAQGAHRNWRITPQGKLEHLSSDGWIQAFPEQRPVFRAVAVIGNQVWAGGDGGALFHSSDGGQHWNKSSLAASENAETAAIVSIRFSDEQHGVVATDRGSTYVTTDGGTTWTKQ